MSELNIELFKKVRDRIATIPESYDQSTWFADTRRSPCGTVACLAGETIICDAPTVDEGISRLRRMYERDDVGFDIPNLAARLLGLNGLYSESHVDNEAVIFVGGAECWPEPYRAQFTNAQSKRAEAAVAVAYLDHIIETGKVLE